MLRRMASHLLHSSIYRKRQPVIKSRQNKFKLSIDHLEERTVPAIWDVTGLGASVTVGNLMVSHIDDSGGGTGQFNPFLRVQQKDVEQGYNTDWRASGNPGQDLLDDDTNIGFTHAIKISDVPEVTIEGVQYRRFSLNLNESGNNDSVASLLNLSRLQFFLSSSNLEHHYDDSGLTPTLGNASLVFDVDAAGDNDFTLQDQGSGNNAVDYTVYLKSSVFGADDTQYVYLYSMFGSPPPTADGAFEAWGISQPATVQSTFSGHKFEDHNGDDATVGISGDDTGLAGWHILVDGQEAGIVTGDDGSWSYTVNELPGTQHTSTELNQSGWTQTFGNDGYTATVGQDQSGLDFANFHDVTISGTKWEDHNGNGVRDTGDQGLSGWHILMNGQDTGLVTDTNGDYSFSAGPGSFTLQEQLQPGWTQTYGNAGYNITTSSGIDVGGNDFGNFHNFAISGMKFFDSDTNGMKSTNEPAISAWPINLLADANANGVQDGSETVVTVNTDSTGTYTFSNLGPLPGGQYVVTEGAAPASYPGQWVQTGPNGGKYLVAAASGNDQASLNFGNVKVVANSNVRTLGFWGNKNGQAILQANDPAWRMAVNSLNLRNANGTNFDVPTTGTFANAYKAFSNWLQGANATNMAYMLSAQLVTMKLNTLYMGVSANTLLYVGANSALLTWGGNGQGANLLANLTSGAMVFGQLPPNSNGFISIGNLIANADAMLTYYNTTSSAGAARTFEEALKIVLDGANNGVPIFVMSLLSGWHDINNNGVIDIGEI